MSLEQLQKQFPLPPNWSIADGFEGSLELIPGALNLRGFIARKNGTADVVSAAAAEAAGNPDTRAYFELIERIATVEAIQAQSTAALFSRSSQPDTWNYAKSNGIALHTDAAEARKRALFELIERDRVIRSWAGGSSPIPIESKDFHPLEVLRDHYALKYFSFEDALDPHAEVCVTATFAFPLARKLPFVYGFGAAESSSTALKKSSDECLQRLGFLWEEEWLGEEPAFSPTPDFHQETYVRYSGMKRVQKWLLNGHAERVPPGSLSTLKSPIEYADITPPSLKGRLHVVKAQAPDRVALTFGRVAPSCNPQCPEELWIHPLL